MRTVDATNRSRVIWPIVLSAAIGLFAVGCGSQSAEEQASAQHEKALHDPFGYSPDPNKPDETVSGNGTFDKEGLKRDVDHVLNP